MNNFLSLLTWQCLKISNILKYIKRNSTQVAGWINVQLHAQQVCCCTRFTYSTESGLSEIYQLWNKYNSPSYQSPKRHIPKSKTRKLGIVLGKQYQPDVRFDLSTWKKQQAIMIHKMILYLGQVYSLRRKHGIKLWCDVIRFKQLNQKKQERSQTDMKTWTSLCLRLQNPWNEIRKSNYPLSPEDIKIPRNNKWIYSHGHLAAYFFLYLYI